MMDRIDINLVHYHYSTTEGSGVLQSACLSLCPRAYLWNRWVDLHEILFADFLWPWLGSLLVALRYVMYFRFLWMTSRSAVMGRKAKRGGRTVTRLPRAALRYQGGVCYL